MTLVLQNPTRIDVSDRNERHMIILNVRDEVFLDVSDEIFFKMNEWVF